MGVNALLFAKKYHRLDVEHRTHTHTHYQNKCKEIILKKKSAIQYGWCVCVAHCQRHSSFEALQIECHIFNVVRFFLFV